MKFKIFYIIAKIFYFNEQAEFEKKLKGDEDGGGLCNAASIAAC